MFFVHSHRGIIAIGGQDRKSFLQGLITNDVNKGPCLYTAMLSPQGKFQHDFFVFDIGNTLYITPEKDRLPALLQRLNMYKLRSDVTLADVTDQWTLVSAKDEGLDNLSSGLQTKGNTGGNPYYGVPNNSTKAPSAIPDLIENPGIITKLEPSSLSDVAFGKVETHNFLGKDAEKDMEYHDKNFPVNKDWVPASAGMTPWEGISSHGQASSNPELKLDIWFPDPRHPDMGHIGLIPADQNLETTWMVYPMQRMALGIPDGQRDMKVDKGIILENNLDELHAIDWKKGCYMGQELMSRTKHLGQIRKRLLPVRIEGPVPPLDSDVMFEGEKAGEMRGVDCKLDPTIGLALLRLEYVQKSLATDQPLQGDRGTLLYPQIPAWLQSTIY